MKVSVIAPMYNEEANVITTLSKLHDEFKNKSYDYELIFVNDGSSDRTLAICKEIELQDDK